MMNKRTVMIVDNSFAPSGIVDGSEQETKSLNALVSFLQERDFDVLTESDWERGCNQFRYDSKSIDLVLLDIRFSRNPEGGIIALDRMKQIDPDIPVVLYPRT